MINLGKRMRAELGAELGEAGLFSRVKISFLGLLTPTSFK